MENQDIDLVGQTVGNMFYKIGIVDKDGKLTNQFVANASTNRVDIPQSALGTSQSQVIQLPSTFNLFSGSAVGNILLSGPSANYDNVQDGLLITLDDESVQQDKSSSKVALSPTITIKIPKEKLIVNSSFDISDQLSQYIGKSANAMYYSYDNNTLNGDPGDFYIHSFSGTTIKILPNTTLNMDINVSIRSSDRNAHLSDYSGDIPVIRVNTYKN